MNKLKQFCEEHGISKDDVGIWIDYESDDVAIARAEVEKIKAENERLKLLIEGKRMMRGGRNELLDRTMLEHHD